MIAATVHGQPIPAAVVDEWLAALPVRRAEQWPGAPRAERQRRRWMTQVVVGAELARQGCAERGLTPLGPDRAGFAPASAEETADLGGIAVAVLQASGHAQALLADFAARIEVSEAEARAYYERNVDRFLTPEGLAAGVDPFRNRRFVRPFAAVRAGIESRLRAAGARRALVDWLDARQAGVRLAEGFEHPADPAQPDAEHKH